MRAGAQQERRNTAASAPAGAWPPIPPAYDVLFDAATQQLDAQFSTADALDSKAATIFSVASTIAAVVPALLPLGKDGVELISWTTLFLALGLAGWVSGLFLFWRTYSLGEWASGPNLDELVGLSAYGEEYTRHWAALAYRLAVNANRHGLERKAGYATWLMRAFAFEVVMLLAAAVSTIAR